MLFHQAEIRANSSSNHSLGTINRGTSGPSLTNVEVVLPGRGPVMLPPDQNLVILDMEGRMKDKDDGDKGQKTGIDEEKAVVGEIIENILERTAAATE